MANNGFTIPASGNGPSWGRPSVCPCADYDRSPKSNTSITSIYGLEPLTDDLATLRYRSNGIQRAPAIIRTRGHRLEGIWHAGSPIGMILNSLRGIYVLVPRNMTQAAGFYNTMLQSDDPALIIESLNGYRLKEKLPENIGEYTVPLGVPEVLREGRDVTLVTYGSCVRIAQAGAGLLEQAGISVELIDVQSLLPLISTIASRNPSKKPTAWSSWMKTFPAAPPPTSSSRSWKSRSIPVSRFRSRDPARTHTVRPMAPTATISASPMPKMCSKPSTK